MWEKSTRHNGDWFTKAIRENRDINGQKSKCYASENYIINLLAKEGKPKGKILERETEITNYIL